MKPWGIGAGSRQDGWVLEIVFAFFTLTCQFLTVLHAWE